MSNIHRIPELYESNLITLTQVLHALEDLTKVDGLFACEIRVRVDDVESWAVIGWGEAGEPCVLRFEDDFKPILSVSEPKAQIYTINKNQASGYYT